MKSSKIFLEAARITDDRWIDCRFAIRTACDKYFVQSSHVFYEDYFHYLFKEQKIYTTARYFGRIKSNKNKQRRVTALLMAYAICKDAKD